MPATGGRILLHGEDAAARGRPRVPRVRRPRADDLPGPVRVAEPGAHRALHAHPQPAHPPRTARRRGPRGRARRAARPRAAHARRALHRQVPARALRRPAPARRDRARPRRRPRGAARRRADLDARRVDPPRHPEPAAGPARPPAPRDPLHHPRHRVGPLLRRPHDGHVRRPHRRERRLRVGDAGPEASVHAAARALGARPRRPRGAGARRARRGAEPRPAPERMPLQPALPVRHRPVPHRGAPADVRRRGPRGRLLGLLGPPRPTRARLGARRVRRAPTVGDDLVEAVVDAADVDAALADAALADAAIAAGGARDEVLPAPVHVLRDHVLGGGHDQLPHPAAPAGRPGERAHREEPGPHLDRRRPRRCARCSASTRTCRSGSSTSTTGG